MFAVDYIAEHFKIMFDLSETWGLVNANVNWADVGKYLQHLKRRAFSGDDQISQIYWLVPMGH